jgi:hypothetical protein
LFPPGFEEFNGLGAEFARTPLPVVSGENLQRITLDFFKAVESQVNSTCN